MNKRARITERNRANASRSTGPRTPRGKAIVSRNARKHGATGRPAPEAVASWLAIILDRPELARDVFVPRTDVEFISLVLAEAEARLATCQDALKVFEAGKEEPSETLQDLRNMRELMTELFLEGPNRKKETRQFYSIMQRIARVELEDCAIGGKRHKLLKRYVREARAGRKKAFDAWVTVYAEARANRRAAADRTELPKQSQFST